MASRRRRLAVLLACTLVAHGASSPFGLAQAPPPDAELASAIALVREGDFEAAMAYLYLGVSFLELDQELTARGKFHSACRLDPELRMDPRQFSAQQIRVFEAACRELRPGAAAPGTSAGPATAGPAAAQ